MTTRTPPTVATQLCQDIVDPQNPGYTSQKLAGLLALAEATHTLACAARAVGGVLEGLSRAAYAVCTKKPPNEAADNALVSDTALAAKEVLVYGTNAIRAVVGAISDPLVAARDNQTVKPADGDTLKGRPATLKDFPVVATLDLASAAGTGADSGAATSVPPRNTRTVAASIQATVHAAIFDPATRRTVIGGAALGVTIRVAQFVVSYTGSLVLG